MSRVRRYSDDRAFITPLRDRVGRLPGFVYLIQAKGTDHYKIGKTFDIATRLKGLQTGSASKLQYVHSCFTSDNSKSEAYFAKMMQPYRIKGEWYLLTPEQVKALISEISAKHEECEYQNFLQKKKEFEEEKMFWHNQALALQQSMADLHERDDYIKKRLKEMKESDNRKKRKTL